jgi:RHS repeat-associated protein
LGSARLETTPTQTIYGDVAYAPYGETYAGSGNIDFSWTGINADVEPANPETLYDFPAREYGIQGRWPSPDPLGMGAVNLANPQSWNRYAYVLNNPLAATDPTGLCSDGVGSDCGGNSVNVNLSGFFDGIEDFFECLFGGCSPPPPHAPPAPPGGYGGGIDPFGCLWCETSTAIPQIGGGGLPGLGPGISWPGDPNGCTYGSGYCGGVIYGLVNIQGAGAQIIETPSGFVFAMTVYGLLTNDNPNQPTMSATSKPNVPRGWDSCSPYMDGTGAGDILYGICMHFPTPDSWPWTTCMRGRLLQQWVPNDNAADLIFNYGVKDHLYYAAICAAGK